MLRNTLLYLAIGLLLSAAFSCRKDAITDPSAELVFSTDTLTFDTVFVSLGSTTLFFTAGNRSNRPVEISGVSLEGGVDSRFRINVDGIPLEEDQVTGISIPPGDSIYIFVEVTIDPGSEPLPFLVEDRILFSMNGREQHVQLIAYGQNAHFFNGEEIESQVWTDDLPYVILNSLLVKECHTLTIREGVEVYLGANSGLFVAGNIQVEGSMDSMVVFRGIRLDDISDDYAYDDIPGQWSGIFLLRSNACDIESSFLYAEIRNAQFGLSLGSTTLEEFEASTIENGPVLTLENCVIRNHSVFGIYSLLSTITARNLLVHTAGSQLLALQMGGRYAFEHCTFHNQGSVFLEHKDEVLYFSNYFADPNIGLLEERPLEQLDFTSCILYGALPEEIVGDTLEEPTAPLNFFFDHCLLRTRMDPGQLGEELIVNQSPRYRDIAEEDFHLDQDSPCINKGNPASAWTTDLDGVVRGSAPDIGAYEFVP